MEFVYITDFNNSRGTEVKTREDARLIVSKRPIKYTQVYDASQVLPFLKYFPSVTLLDVNEVNKLGDNEIDVGVFLWLSNTWKEKYDVFVNKCKKIFVVGDIHTCGQNLKTYEVFSKYRNKFTVLAFSYMQVDWIKKVTGCESFLYPPVFLDSNSFSYRKNKDRELLVFGAWNQRGGLWSQSFVNAHYDVSDFDIITRLFDYSHSMHTIGYEKPIMKKVKINDWPSLLGRYKYIIDGCDYFHQGRIGLDSLLTGTCYIGMKGISYASYLFSELNFDRDLGTRPPNDTERIFQNALSRVITLEQVEDSVGEYL